MNMKEKKIGFLGLGSMGFPIAYGLFRSGWKMVIPAYRPCSLRGYSPIAPDQATKQERFMEMLSGGAEGAESQEKLIESSDVLILSLPTSKQVEEVVLGDDGILNHAAEGMIVIDLTSADAESTRKLSGLLEKRGIEFLDAPISGGTIGASKQTLSVMIGGKKKVYEQVKEIFDTIGSPEKIFYLGPSGAGNVAKCANNFLSSCCFAATTEALMVCAKAGIDPQVAARLINSSGGSSSATSHKFPNLIFPGKDMGMSVNLMLKDINLFLEAGKKYRVPTFIGDTTYQLWNLPVAEGHGGEDLKAFIEMYERLCQVSLNGIGAEGKETK